MSEKILLLIAKSIIEKNYGSALTGSLMLFTRGLKKRREAHDIDILVTSIEGIIIPDEFNQASPQYPDSIKFECDGLVVDFLLNKNEEIEIVNGIPCGSLDKLLDAKAKYSMQSGDQAMKHKEDLEFLNYKLTEQIPFNEDDLPF